MPEVSPTIQLNIMLSVKPMMVLISNKKIKAVFVKWKLAPSFCWVNDFISSAKVKERKCY